ncbi:MAG: PQQ-like beta-propeller repeat protein [Synergistaceae bacterium]|nr:PQQ-like beta-propeller repeat protein [Synergistaceae bacterium]MBQ3346817.1 PQQ-like beta-propeller repeat protein [Synergistaceae bacterium]MBQ3398650.1 PQQ-like beta-propeller repeat protein [Synergistaceae bacterium]MBQ3758022.1 PQQ-like beta-propeller repeat protein [Synergistaceae bacterium]MBQ6115158.1 PQQ-like beta-propeller repeat protein [Synergistaceae bacterium]
MKKVCIAVFVFVLALFAAQAWAVEGKLVWRFPYDARITSGVSLSGHTLLFGDQTGRFYAVNSNTGKVIWAKQGTTSMVCGTPSITAHGHVIFAQEDGAITCLSISNGARHWSYVPNEHDDMHEVDTHEALTDGTTVGGGKVFAAKADRKLYAHDERNGKVDWTYLASDQGLRTAPSYSGGLVFLGEYDGTFSVINARNGKRIGGGGAGGALNTPTVKDGVVYFSSWDGSVTAVKIDGIEHLWTAKVGDPITTQPTVAEGIVVVGTGRGKVVALNARNGAEVWRCESLVRDGEIAAAPLIGGGVVLAAQASGNVIVLDAKTGELKNAITELDGMTYDGFYADGTFYFVSSGEVCAVN